MQCALLAQASEDLRKCRVEELCGPDGPSIGLGFRVLGLGPKRSPSIPKGSMYLH